MGIEPRQHAVDRRLDQLAVVGFLDVVGAHPLEYVAEEGKLPIGIGSGRVRARSVERDPRLRRDHRQGGARGGAEENQGGGSRHRDSSLVTRPPGSSCLSKIRSYVTISGVPLVPSLPVARAGS